jgi:hypothetical protein
VPAWEALRNGSLFYSHGQRREYLGGASLRLGLDSRVVSYEACLPYSFFLHGLQLLVPFSSYLRPVGRIMDDLKNFCCLHPHCTDYGQRRRPRG